MNEEQLIIGFIRSSHGVTGKVKVESTSGYYDHFEKLTEVTLQHGSVQKLCKVESAEIGANTVFLKLSGIDSPEEAKKYANWDIKVPRKYAHPLSKDEWYIEDLKKCSLIWNDGLAEKSAPITIGTITDVLEGGGGYLLEVSVSECCTALSEDLRTKSDGSKRTVLVPFNNHHVGKVDIKNKTVQLMHLWVLE